MADLSEDLIGKARLYGEDRCTSPVSYDVINATDLSRYADSEFDAVILLGPLYHLLETSERMKCVSEVRRVLRPGGVVFAGFIPRLSGGIGLIDRFFNHPCQVDAATLEQAFHSGKFSNLADAGFQEGYYHSIDEIKELFRANSFDQVHLRSLRSIGYGKENALYKLEEEDPEMFKTTMRLLNETSTDMSVIEMCGHAIYVGQKNK